MAAQSYNIRFRSSQLHYKRFGNGAEWLFCLHGYGEDADSFLMMEKWLEHQFTIIAVDFPSHGKTDWQEGLLLEPDDLISIIDQINPPPIKKYTYWHTAWVGEWLYNYYN